MNNSPFSLSNLIRYVLTIFVFSSVLAGCGGSDSPPAATQQVAETVADIPDEPTTSPSDTPIPPTATPVPPTATSIPATATEIPASATPEALILFQDDFSSSELLPVWSTTGGLSALAGQEEDGISYIRLTNTSDSTNAGLMLDFAEPGYTVYIRFRTIENNSAQSPSMTLELRMNDEASTYVFASLNEKSGQASLAQLVQFDWKELESIEFESDEGEWQVLSVQVNQDLLTIHLDDQLLLEGQTDVVEGQNLRLSIGASSQVDVDYILVTE